jgi:hypothetical protein
MNRGNLEEAIKEAWQTQSDVKLVFERVMDGYGDLTEDEVANALIGIEALMEMRFLKLWEVYEQMLEENVIHD